MTELASILRSRGWATKIDSAGNLQLTPGETNFSNSGDTKDILIRPGADLASFPGNYLQQQEQQMLDDYRQQLDAAIVTGTPLPEFPEPLVSQHIDNTWRDTARAVVGNWMGAIYQVTHSSRKGLFMEGIDPLDPLDLGLQTVAK